MQRRSVLCRPVLVAALSAAFLASPWAARAQTVRAGEIALELGGLAPSYLGVDLVQLEASLCASTVPSTKDPKLVVANDGGHTGRSFTLDAVAATELSGGTAIVVDFAASGLHLAGPSPFVTTCGSWAYQVTLDPGRIAPPAALTLIRNRPADVSGAFSGSVTVPALLELVPQAGGPSQWRFYTLTLSLAGTWGLAPPPSGKGGSTPPAGSNLVLYAQRSGGAWVKSPQTATQQSAEDSNSGQLVLQPTDAALGALDAGH